MVMSEQKPIILVVDDDEGFALFVVAFFSHYQYNVIMARSYMEAIEVLHKNPGRIVAFIDLNMPGDKDGYDLLAYINKLMRHRVIAYALTGEPDIERRRKALKAGAIHVFKKGQFGDLDWDDILIHAENDVATRLTEDATRDDRTGLLLLTVFDQIAESELRDSWAELAGPEGKKERASSRPHVFSYATLDLDRFHDFNEMYGHETGHRYLRAVGRAIQEHVRLSDHPCRSGGDEFSILFLGADKAMADRICRKLQKAVQNLEVLDSKGEVVRSSTSFGIAELRREDIGEDAKASLDDLKERSDAALFEAKAARNGGQTVRK